MPQISIVMPTHNDEKYLDKCIRSILNQTFNEFELIIVDDGSIDNTINICRKYSNSDSRIRVIQQKNLGVSNARNTGLDLIVGEYVTFVDSDDYLEPNHIEVLLSACLEEKADKLVSVSYFFESSKECKSIIPNTPTVNSNNFLSEVFLNRAVYGFVWNKMFAASIINGADKIRFNENIFVCEDLLFVCEYLMKVKKLIVLSTSTYHYVQNKDSMINSTISEANFFKKKSEILARELILDVIDSNDNVNVVIQKNQLFALMLRLYAYCIYLKIDDKFFFKKKIIYFMKDNKLKSIKSKQIVKAIILLVVPSSCRFFIKSSN